MPISTPESNLFSWFDGFRGSHQCRFPRKILQTFRTVGQCNSTWRCQDLQVCLRLSWISTFRSVPTATMSALLYPVRPHVFSEFYRDPRTLDSRMQGAPGQSLFTLFCFVCSAHSFLLDIGSRPLHWSVAVYCHADIFSVSGAFILIHGHRAFPGGMDGMTVLLLSLDQVITALLSLSTRGAIDFVSLHLQPHLYHWLPHMIWISFGVTRSRTWILWCKVSLVWFPQWTCKAGSYRT